MLDTLHNAIIDKACRDSGWQRGDWRKPFIARARAHPDWADEVTDEEQEELFGDFQLRPDAYRIIVEGPDTPDRDWERDVLVLELLEVEITHPMSLDKRRAYVALWMNFDGSDYFHLRVYRAERYTRPIVWLDFDTLAYEIGI